MEQTRRDFLKSSVALAAGVNPLTARTDEPAAAGSKTPWYRRARRWGQTNITEIDPTRYDVGWWRQQWKKTRAQGAIINAGGIVAYYPTKVPMQRRAQFLGDRDMFGEVCRAAHEDGLAVLARMDSNSADDEFYKAHPDWFAVDAAGKPYRAGDLYIGCVNGPYYNQHIPAIMREIIGLYQPEGLTDNNWSGLHRDRICYCGNCREKFRKYSGKDLPQQKDWNDTAYRQWIQWSYTTRLEIWDLNNRVTNEAGGPDCLWIGMNGGNISGQTQSFRDFKEICVRAKIIMLDDQCRANESGFQRNSEVGKLIHGLLGWEKLIPESMAMYQMGAAPTFRLTSKPEPEARLWMLEGAAGGIQPWWHYVSAYHEDRRMYRTPVPICQWYADNEEYLVDRQPVATVGLVWSQLNHDFFGRDAADVLVTLPWRGWSTALVRARIPYVMVHINHIARDADGLRTLILPNVGSMTEAQATAVRQFVKGGGGLIATGQAGLCDEWGDTRSDFALADVLGVHLPEKHGFRDEATRLQWANDTTQSYLRLTPELRARVEGPHFAGEPAATGTRHPALRGFDETDILAFGGTLEPLQLDSSAQALLTFVPSFPAFPPELAWMRVPKTDIPGLIVNEKAGAGRVAYLPADIDRRYARDNMPDHGVLLANLVRWTANEDIPLTVEGPGFLDCHLYRKENRLVLHLLNLTNANTWRGPADELIPIGPLKVSVKLPDGVDGKTIRSLVTGKTAAVTLHDRTASFAVSSVLDHEVFVIG